MTKTIEQTISLLEMLPDKEQNLALAFVKRLVLAWDPDFTKVTPQEAKELEEAEHNFKNGDMISHDDINWE